MCIAGGCHNLVRGAVLGFAWMHRKTVKILSPLMLDSLWRAEPKPPEYEPGLLPTPTATLGKLTQLTFSVR
jgi:hypothetical protein